MSGDIYRHFVEHPEDLYRLPHRDFEELISSVFTARRWKTQIGPGTADEGVDAVQSAKAKALAHESVDRLLAEVRAAGTHPALVYRLKRYPSFCLVLRETPTGALLMPIPSEATSSDGQAGYVLPVLDGRLNYQTPDRGVFRAIRTERDSDVSSWGGGDLYSSWGGKALGFDFWD